MELAKNDVPFQQHKVKIMVNSGLQLEFVIRNEAVIWQSECNQNPIRNFFERIVVGILLIRTSFAVS